MDYGCGGNDGVLLRRSGEHIRTAHWLASPHHSTLSHSHQHYHPHHTISMSFSNASCFDNVLGMIHGESSTIPPSHSKASARTPASHPQGHQTPKPPRSSSFPCQPVTPTIQFNVNQYKLCRGTVSSLTLFLPKSAKCPHSFTQPMTHFPFPFST